jgi:hypothetical protein
MACSRVNFTFTLPTKLCKERGTWISHFSSTNKWCSTFQISSPVHMFQPRCFKIWIFSCIKTQVLKRNSICKLLCHWIGQTEAELELDAEKSKLHFVSDCASYFCIRVVYWHNDHQIQLLMFIVFINAFLLLLQKPLLFWVDSRKYLVSPWWKECGI